MSTSTVLKPSGFILSISNGCEFVNKNNGQNEISFNLYLTNRFNMSVHYTSVSPSVMLGIGMEGGGIVIPLDVSHKSSNFTNNYTLGVTFPMSFIPTNSTLPFLSVVVGAHVQEVSDVILKSLNVTLTPAYPACST